MGNEPTLIDLFAGAGGLTLGFTRAGFHPLLAVEIDPSAARTYSANFGGHVRALAIEQVEAFPPADIVIGGPPCQGFSPLGRDRDQHSRAQLNELWQHFVRAVVAIRPRAFLIENVPQFLRSRQFDEFQRMFAGTADLSEYEIEARVVNAVDYGVPQRRRRGFILGSRVGAPEWPEQTHGAGLGMKPVATVREAFEGIPLDPDGLNWHIGRNPTPKSMERYKAIPAGGNRFDLARNRPDLLPECWRRKPTGTTDVFGRLWWDEPALTIRTEFFKPEKGRYLHPEQHRPITHREAARLQTFPDDFAFEGPRIEVARQIGNAVPPVLAEAIAASVRLMIS